jgi:hypothetical protein
MGYNIGIFKSESYQKILKAVLKVRHHGLSYEEALRTEDGEDSFCIVNDHLYFGIDLEPQDYGTLIRLGRPITICEIVDVLEEVNSTGHLYEYRVETLVCFYDGGEEVEIVEVKLQSKTYYLHEQPQEIIDEIAELLD